MYIAYAMRGEFVVSLGCHPRRQTNMFNRIWKKDDDDDDPQLTTSPAVETAHQ